MSPSVPELGALRPALGSDIARIGVVATAGFRYSPVFQWERPYHEKFPEDTLNSYKDLFAKIIQDRQYIVLVAEDYFDPDEAKKSSAIVLPGSEANKPKAGEKVVVGVACWKLEEGSKRVGQFGNITDCPPEQGQLGRDKNGEHCRLFDEIAEAAGQRYFKGHSEMDMVVVHPAYWKRGHGTALVKWGMAIADIDRVKQGVIAADMGAKLYLSLGYSKVADVHVDGDEEAPDGVTCTVAIYEPKL